MAFLLLVLGLAGLVAGGECLIRGASRMAARLGVSPLLIGLTVVAYGTSAPELAVALQGQPDITMGNVVGSNIFNVLGILGLSATITPLVVAQQLVRFDVPLMIGASFLLGLCGMDGGIGRSDGLLFCLLAVAYTALAIRKGRAESTAVENEYEQHYGRGARRSVWAANIALIVSGLVLLVFGSRWMLSGAVSTARAMGVSELVIALTIVAVGTSLPEVTTSVLAAYKGERDIAVGNVVGSNLFNILWVLGLAAIVSPKAITVSPAALAFDLPVMIAVAVACLPIFLTGHEIARWEGFLFMGYYTAYVCYLVLTATRHHLLPAFSHAMLAFVIPVTVLTLVVSLTRSLRRQAPRSDPSR